MIQQLINQLRELKLNAMISALELQMAAPGTYEDLAFIERLGLLAEQELQSRSQRKQSRLITQANFKLKASVQQIDYQHNRNLQKAQMAQLSTVNWIRSYQNLLITGPCGTGKTYLACALGHQACLNGLSAMYCRFSRLLLMLTQSKIDGSYLKFLAKLSKINLLILDDWGLEPLKPAHRQDMLEIMDERHKQSSTVIVSQLPTEQWHVCVDDNTLADAILDRLMSNAHRIKLTGESMRKKEPLHDESEQ